MTSRCDAAEGAHLSADNGPLDLSIARVVPVRGERSGTFRPFLIVPAYDAPVVGG